MLRLLLFQFLKKLIYGIFEGCYGIALTNRYYIVDPKERLVELVG